ncbi:MAG: DNA-directed RNA polymerase subunit omega [Clostridiales bacterium]|nr:DNA-directed RNA polymerase subunit omega [Clostridiales bacterium]
MLYPPMSDLLKKINSRYLLVNVVAKRSRDLSEAAFEKGEPLGAKPVSVAINQLANGEYTAESKGEY